MYRLREYIIVLTDWDDPQNIAYLIEPVRVGKEERIGSMDRSKAKRFLSIQEAMDTIKEYTDTTSLTCTYKMEVKQA